MSNLANTSSVGRGGIRLLNIELFMGSLAHQRVRFSCSIISEARPKNRCAGNGFWVLVCHASPSTWASGPSPEDTRLFLYFGLQRKPTPICLTALRKCSSIRPSVAIGFYSFYVLNSIDFNRGLSNEFYGFFH